MCERCEAGIHDIVKVGAESEAKVRARGILGRDSANNSKLLADAAYVNGTKMQGISRKFGKSSMTNSPQSESAAADASLGDP